MQQYLINDNFDLINILNHNLDKKPLNFTEGFPKEFNTPPSEFVLKHLYLFYYDESLNIPENATADYDEDSGIYLYFNKNDIEYTVSIADYGNNPDFFFTKKKKGENTKGWKSTKTYEEFLENFKKEYEN